MKFNEYFKVALFAAAYSSVLYFFFNHDAKSLVGASLAGILVYWFLADGD